MHPQSPGVSLKSNHDQVRGDSFPDFPPLSETGPECLQGPPSDTPGLLLVFLVSILGRRDGRGSLTEGPRVGRWRGERKADRHDRPDRDPESVRP